MPDSEYKKGRIVSFLLASKDFEPGIVLAEHLVRRNLTHRDFNLNVKDLSPQVQNVFREIGIIKRRSSSIVDQTGEILSKRYEIYQFTKWKNVLKNEYIHTLQILIQADAAYKPSRSHWLQLQNSFNDALLRAFITFLNDSENERDKEAKQLRAFHGDDHGIFALDMVDGILGVFSWSAAFFMNETG